MDKILTGARPRELAIEQPTVFELVVNRKTANATGFRMPNSILLQGDRIVE